MIRKGSNRGGWDVMGCPELCLTDRKATDAVRLVDIESTTREPESEARVSFSIKSMNRVACKVHM